MNSMFSVSALFVCEHFPTLTNERKRLWEEQIICISCFEQEVFKRSYNFFKSKEIEYETINGKAKWIFWGIIDIYTVPEYEIIKIHCSAEEPVEFFSRHLTDRQAKELYQQNTTFQEYCRYVVSAD